MNKPISYELAKLLKPKGFNEPCQMLRVGGKYRINYEKEGELFNNGMPSTQIPKDWFLAPTISQVVIWLCDKHGIWIVVEPDCYGEIWFPRLKVCSKSVWENIELRNKIALAIMYECKSPIEAYEKGIKHILKNIL